MNILIPLGGIGKRFMDFGYQKPKPLIKVLGKEIIFWLLDSLILTDDDCVYIPYNEMLDYYSFESVVKSKYPKVKLHPIPNTRGASETILLSIELFNLQGRVVILDGDTWYGENILEIVRSVDGSLITYFDSITPTPIYSYVDVKDGLVRQIEEKIKISDKANTGCYVFNSVIDLKKTILEIGFSDQSELYTSQVIKRMIANGFDFKAIKVEDFFVLGTPHQIIEFAKTYRVESKRFCFDLDNTLVSYPTTIGDYTTVEPILETINYLRKLKESGNTIIIYTARRMKTHSGNVGAVIADIAKTTINTLEKFNIPYDELYFGKPFAHHYIDDLMVDPFLDLNKSLGYYLEEVQPRHFNKIDRGDTFIKSSNDAKLKGEKEYYEWIANSHNTHLIHLFPHLISHNETSIEIEYVKGLNFSTLYVNEILTTKDIEKLVDAIKYLHTINAYTDASKKYTYHPLSEKFKQRIGMYDYEKYGLSVDDVNTTIGGLQSIEGNGFYDVLVHGDCVFSNVIMNDIGDIKLVDVRGVVGNDYTPFGMGLYDFAKIYQSIVGYDEILLDKKMKVSYKDSIRKYYESLFDVEVLSQIKIITASLFFSLIPLHTEHQKYHKYIKLGKELLYGK